MVVSWHCLFSKHMVIHHCLSGILQLKVLSAKIYLQLQQLSHVASASLSLGRKELLKFYSCSSLCYITKYHLSDFPFLKYTYWTSLHGVRFTNFSKQRKDRVSGPLPKITQEGRVKVVSSCHNVLCHVVVFQLRMTRVTVRLLKTSWVLLLAYGSIHHCFL